MSSYETDGGTCGNDRPLPWVGNRLREHEPTRVDRASNIFEFEGGDSRSPRNQKSGSIALGTSFETSTNSESSSSATSNQSSTGCTERLLRSSRSEEQDGIANPYALEKRIENVQESSTGAKMPWDVLLRGPESSDLILQQHAILRQIRDDQVKQRPASRAGAKEASHDGDSKSRTINEDPTASSVTSVSSSQQLRFCGKSFDTLSASSYERCTSECQASSSPQMASSLSKIELSIDCNDPSLIAEQHRIMKQIEEERARLRVGIESSSILKRVEQSKASSSKLTTWEESPRTEPTGSPVDAYHGHQRKSYPPSSTDTLSSFKQAARGSAKNPSASNISSLKAHRISAHQLGAKGSKPSNSEDDKKCLRYGRRKILVRDNKDTVAAIALGKAILIQCPGCQTVLQVDQSAKLLYCTVCNGLSRIERTFHSDHDYTIARAVQDEELHLALKRQFEKKEKSSLRAP